jgi:octaprenyl-diphosphate synthase
MNSLKEIQKPIRDDLEEFESLFKEYMSSKVPLLDKIMYYIVQRKGKQIRPLFVFLSAQLHQPINKSTHIAASLIELLHTATLVHDDVVDDSYQRRGFFSVNALWKNKIAVLVGDYLFSKGMLLALDNEEFKILQIFSRSVKQISEGELQQLEKTRKLDIQEDTYFEIIKAKTASLIAAACGTGAYSVTRDDAILEKMWHFGELVGIAYQIKDDIFDYGGVDIGKPTGNDIKEKKMTLPLIHVLSKADKKDRRWMLKTVKKYNEDSHKVKELIQYVHNQGGVTYAASRMHEIKEEALAILDDFPDSEAKTSLRQLVRFVVERKK